MRRQGQVPAQQAKGSAKQPPDAVETAALTFLANADYGKAAELLYVMREKNGVRVFRPAILRAALAVFRAAAQGSLSLIDAFTRVREANRSTGRLLPRRSVGSTLLFKGLEAEVAVVMDAHDLDAKNLYVAMTRGSMSLVVCSPSPVLNPPRVE